MGLIYLDSCLVIYLVERHPRWGKPVAAAMTRATEARFAISPPVICECRVAPIRRGDPVLRRAYDEIFARFVILDIPHAVWLQAAELRARFAPRMPDALHLACAQYHGCEALWTNDDRLTRTSHGLAHDILTDHVPED